MNEQLNNAKLTKRFLYCLSAVVTISFCAAFLMSQTGGVITAKDQKAKEAVDAAIKAIGGADKIGGIKSLIFKGSQRFTTNPQNLKDGVERRILLPDSFINIIQTYNGMTLFDGVSRGTLIPPMAKMSTAMAKVLPPERIELVVKDDAALEKYQINEKTDDWTRFLIGTLMMSPVPLTISSGSSPGVFTLAKKDGVLGEIEFDSKTGYPSVIRYKIPAEPKLLSGGIRISDVGGAVGQVAKDGEIRFQDQFPVNDIMFPKVIITTNIVGQRIEIKIEEVQINPKLTLKDFEIPDSPLIKNKGASAK